MATLEIEGIEESSLVTINLFSMSVSLFLFCK